VKASRGIDHTFQGAVHHRVPSEAAPQIPAASRGFVNDEVIVQGRPEIVKMCVTGTDQYE
jgi:hypothetical protein